MTMAAEAQRGMRTRTTSPDLGWLCVVFFFYYEISTFIHGSASGNLQSSRDKPPTWLPSSWVVEHHPNPSNFMSVCICSLPYLRCESFLWTHAPHNPTRPRSCTLPPPGDPGQVSDPVTSWRGPNSVTAAVTSLPLFLGWDNGLTHRKTDHHPCARIHVQALCTADGRHILLTHVMHW